MCPQDSVRGNPGTLSSRVTPEFPCLDKRGLTSVQVSYQSRSNAKFRTAQSTVILRAVWGGEQDSGKPQEA